MNFSLSESLFGPLLRVQDSMSFWERISVPEDISTQGHLITWLLNYTHVVNLMWFTLVCLGLFGFCFFYSQKRNKKPYYTHGNEKRHLILTAAIGISVFVSIDMVITRVSTKDLKEVFWNFPENDPDIVRIQVLAQQWAWNFRYAGKDGEFNTADDIVQLNQMVIPVNKKVVIQMTSKDVIHSLYIPNILLKADAIPGRYAKMWFETTKTGNYEIACAEMCGTHHYLMKAHMTILDQEQFDRWENEAQEMAIATNDAEDADLRWGWPWGSR